MLELCFNWLHLKIILCVALVSIIASRRNMMGGITATLPRPLIYIVYICTEWSIMFLESKKVWFYCLHFMACLLHPSAKPLCWWCDAEMGTQAIWKGDQAGWPLHGANERERKEPVILLPSRGVMTGCCCWRERDWRKGEKGVKMVITPKTKRP